MNIREVPHRLEISFWTVIITLMSETPQVGSWFAVIQGIRSPGIRSTEKRSRFFKQVLIWCAAGWAAGFLLALFKFL